MKYYIGEDDTLLCSIGLYKMTCPSHASYDGVHIPEETIAWIERVTREHEEVQEHLYKLYQEQQSTLCELEKQYYTDRTKEQTGVL